jgi:hypothetical protein
MGTAKPGGMYIKHIQKVHIIKGLLIFVLAPPAGYKPRHCRGTPFKTLYLQLQNNLYFCRKILMYNHID